MFLLPTFEKSAYFGGKTASIPWTIVLTLFPIFIWRIASQFKTKSMRFLLSVASVVMFVALPFEIGGFDNFKLRFAYAVLCYHFAYKIIQWAFIEQQSFRNLQTFTGLMQSDFFFFRKSEIPYWPFRRFHYGYGFRVAYFLFGLIVCQTMMDLFIQYTRTLTPSFCVASNFLTMQHAVSYYVLGTTIYFVLASKGWLCALLGTLSGLKFLDFDLFAMPFLATSVSSLWGHRWHQTFRSTWVAISYRPLRNTLQKHLGKNDLVKILSIMSVFLCSGLFHELITWSGARTLKSPKILGVRVSEYPGSQILFFLIQGTYVSMIEPVIYKILEGLNLPAMFETGIKWCLTHSFIAVSGRLFVLSYAQVACGSLSMPQYSFSLLPLIL